MNPAPLRNPGWPFPRRATREILEVFVFSRVGLLMAGWVALGRLPWKYYSPVYNVTHNPLVLMWVRWDALWYISIAAHGYWSQALAFFPGYPLAIAGLHWITRLPTYDSAVVVSNLMTVGYFFGLYGLVREFYPDRVARRTVWMAALYPTAFFLSAAYTESTFLCLAVWGFWLAKRHQWWWAGAVGGLAALTRNEGAFLVIPLGWYYIRVYGWRLRWPLLAVGLVPLGIAVYMGYQWVTFATPLAFIHAQAYWGRHITWPWVGLAAAFYRIWQGTPLQPGTVLSMIDLLSALASASLWIYAWRRRLPPDWLAFWGILWCVDISDPQLGGASPLLSMSRLVLILFPTYAALGILTGNPSWRRFLQWIFPLLQATLFAVFSTWHWIA